ncbi:hypothetical protein NIES2107_19180 [Nostoc carneum NIES-2107]|nr:hypothetical protein NIES2107_19180 [Nostoc carneum NIES-2107]
MAILYSFQWFQTALMSIDFTPKCHSKAKRQNYCLDGYFAVKN